MISGLFFFCREAWRRKSLAFCGSTDMRRDEVKEALGMSIFVS
jgi:hypothetical protein